MRDSEVAKHVLHATWPMGKLKRPPTMDDSKLADCIVMEELIAEEKGEAG
jgi:hypothetical protein